jgi:3-hydroxyacyl-CoA dehydrogenase
VVNDSPGLRLVAPGRGLGLEAMRMLEEGVASAADIDTAMTLGYRHPMGPLRLTDLVGLDVRLDIAEYLHEKLGGERFRPPEILREKVARGELGRKTGPDSSSGRPTLGWRTARGDHELRDTGSSGRGEWRRSPSTGPRSATR